MHARHLDFKKRRLLQRKTLPSMARITRAASQDEHPSQFQDRRIAGTDSQTRTWTTARHSTTLPRDTPMRIRNMLTNTKHAGYFLYHSIGMYPGKEQELAEGRRGVCRGLGRAE